MFQWQQAIKVNVYWTFLFYLENIMVMTLVNFFQKKNSFGVFLHVAPQVVFRSPSGEN